MRNYKKHLCILLLLSVLTLTGCQKSAEVSAIPELLNPVGVELDTAVVTREDLSSLLIYNGSVLPYVEELSFLVDGILKEMNVANGDMVKKGQVIATLDGEKLEEQIIALEDKLAHLTRTAEFSDRLAEIDIAIAKEQYETISSYESRLKKEMDINIMETNLRQTKELRELEFNKLNSELEQLNTKLENYELTAPFDGQIVYTIPKNLGDSIKGYTPVVCIADINQLSIVSEHISEREIARANKVEGKILGNTYDLTYIELTEEEYMEMLLDGSGVKSFFKIEDKNAELQSGQSVTVLLHTNAVKDTLTIPINALHRDELSNYVYKIVDGERVRCDIKTGVITKVKAEVLEGLQEGDVIYVKE